MIYISIDNDYHTEIAIKFIKDFRIKREEIVFICNKSPRNNFIYTQPFNFIDVEGHPFSSGSGFKHVRTYIDAIKHRAKLKKMIKFQSKDVLIVLTEYQINNAFFVKMIKKKYGKVYLIDEGIGFYFNNHIYHKSNNKLKDYLFIYLYTLIFKLFSLPIYAKKAHEGKMFVCIQDRLIDKFYSSVPITIDREFKVIRYKRIDKKLHNIKNKENVIYFANNFESFNLKEEEKMMAKNVINFLATNFDNVFIKVHPQDFWSKSDLFYFYKSLCKFNIRLINKDITSNQAIKEIKPSMLVGSMSTALFDGMVSGYKVIFTYHLLPKIKEFDIYNLVLNELNYKFIRNINDIEKYI